MQTPAPDEGGEWKKDWFNIIDKAELPNGIRWTSIIDGAYIKETKNDPTGIQVGGVINGNCTILSSNHSCLEIPQLRDYIKPYYDGLGVNVGLTLVEPKASGKSLKQLLVTEKRMNVSEINTNLTKQDKHARASSPSVKMTNQFI